MLIINYLIFSDVLGEGVLGKFGETAKPYPPVAVAKLIKRLRHWPFWRGASPWHFLGLKQCSINVKILSRLIRNRWGDQEVLGFSVSFPSVNFTVTSREKSKHWPPENEYFFKQSCRQAQIKQINGSCLRFFSSILYSPK
jgi:hypothetical protein